MTYEYDAFGKVTKEEDGVGWKRNNYKFVGTYGVQDDPASGMHYMLNRYYDPQIGRFITKDPILEPIIWEIYYSSIKGRPLPQNLQIGIRQGFQLLTIFIPQLNSYIKQVWLTSYLKITTQKLHLYVYVQNNPINLTDFTGLGPPSECEFYKGFYKCKEGSSQPSQYERIAYEVCIRAGDNLWSNCVRNCLIDYYKRDQSLSSIVESHALCITGCTIAMF